MFVYYVLIMLVFAHPLYVISYEMSDIYDITNYYHVSPYCSLASSWPYSQIHIFTLTLLLCPIHSIFIPIPCPIPTFSISASHNPILGNSLKSQDALVATVSAFQGFSYLFWYNLELMPDPPRGHGLQISCTFFHSYPTEYIYP